MKSSKIGLSTDPYKKRDSFTPFCVYAARSCSLSPRWDYLAFCTGVIPFGAHPLRWYMPDLLKPDSSINTK